MSNAWGHTVRPLTETEITAQIRSGENWFESRQKHPNLSWDTLREKPLAYFIHHERKCRISTKCQNESTHLLKYLYITGRAGRKSSAEKPICEQHAKKYKQATA